MSTNLGGWPCRVASVTHTGVAIKNLFRMTQEAVNNAVKYSKATKITLKMISTPDTTILEIKDNGCCIGNLADFEAKGGMGMHTMQYRTSLLCAKFDVRETSGGGTSITVSLSALHTL